MKTKIDLWDVTFNIILRLDSIERLENIIASITFLNRHFNTNVTVWECSYRDNGFLKKLLDNARVVMYLNKMMIPYYLGLIILIK